MREKERRIERKTERGLSYGCYVCTALCVIRASNAESVPLMRGNNDLACLSLLSSLCRARRAGLTLFASSNASNNALSSLSLGSIRARPVSTENRQQVSLCDRIRNRHSTRHEHSCHPRRLAPTDSFNLRIRKPLSILSRYRPELLLFAS